MPTQDEIAKLAREYAEDATKAVVSDPNLSDTDIKGIKRDVAEYAEQVISWLLRTHCIVSKEKVRNHYNMAKSNIKTQYLEACQFEVGATKVLESLFDAETFKDREV